MKSIPLLVIFACFLCHSQRSDFSHIDYKKADSMATVHQGESLQNLPVLTHKLTATLATDVEKFRAIYSWVSTNIENDYSSYLKTSRKRKKLFKDREALLQWNHNFTPKVFQKLLNENKTACTGYAYLIRELTQLAGINCKIIDGYGRTASLNLNKNSLPNHSWNAVELNGKWYLADATWSAGRILIEDGIPQFKSDYHDGYFLADPVLFIKNHYPLEIEWALLSKPFSFDQFTTGPIIYKEAFSSNIIPLVPNKMHFETLKNENVVFYLNVPETFKSKSISLLLSNGISNKSVLPIVTQDQNKCRLNYAFDMTGTYDVHVKVNDDIIATYVVRVRRK